jgi:16S rRNA processing protein RimM
LIETGANDVLVVVADSTKNKTEHLIPYIQGQVIKSIDLDKQQIQVEWDLDY